MTLVAVLLAGGTGTRLYPASRSDRPKQFLSFGDDISLLRQTADRAAFADELVVVTRPAFADEAAEHAPEATILTEPEGKDTGPALVYAADAVRERFGDDCVLLCLPADHHVEGDFETTARRACETAVSTGGLVTIGIEPDRPATGYGYIEPGESTGVDVPPDASVDVPPNGGVDVPPDATPVASFREKPDADTAVTLVEKGCLWNAGMFAWTPDAFLREARETVLEPLVDALDDGDAAGGFVAVESVSVDYAVLEETKNAYVVPASFEWDDLGAWDAIARVVGEDDAGNATLGDSLTIDASGNVVASEDKHVSVVGVDDLVVVSFDDRVLVVPKDDAQRVREVVTVLREQGLF